jgi:hypothetical protein
MKYAVEMGSGAVVRIPSFIRIGSGIQKCMEGGGGYKDIQTGWRSQNNTFIFSK